MDGAFLSETVLKQTPLDGFHRAHGAKMVAFAGHALPIHYATGVIKEHLHTRSAASLFDVSHMGQIRIRPDGTNLVDLCLALEHLVPIDVLGLATGRQRYGVLTDRDGGILDDFMLAKVPGELFMVVNGAQREADAAYLRDHLSEGCRIDTMFADRALLALQGPASETALTRLFPGARDMRFLDIRDATIAGAACLVTRSGYTGEDGFEISVPIGVAQGIAESLADMDEVRPAGLGARDTLRMEAGLCLYGSDIDETTTPVEAGISWAIPRVRRSGGDRCGGFPGAERILDEIDREPGRLRVGIAPEGRAPMRAGARIFLDAETPSPIGTVTSGGFGPSLGAPVSMGYVATSHSQPGTRFHVETRGRRLPAQVTALPFVQPRYRRA